ncbi:MAG: leucine-rich repeat domain-containing protein [Salinivirgaceae bacterium]|nr:leucine-rich repeat domain-containing protein [Salinivirgaceae bacterium]MDD4746026.1 leucine-rich repeat domain-containing protein [Salinivirgaceae bacterium]MDY0280376.1 leucine-rich repeat domain-containing protein [Salinivirgaceae bacterium]
MDKDDILEIIRTVIINKVTRLDLSNRDIREVPSEIGQLVNLEHLDLSYNFIEKLPPEIGNLVNLKTLLLLKNEIRTIPPEIGNLTKLNLVDISHNRFHELPSTIGYLTELKTLDASYGLMERLPLEFIDLLSLKELYLEENPFVYPPAKVVKRGLYATMHFLTNEKKREEASHVILQVFNMPEIIQRPFSQYLSYFNDVITTVNQHEVHFDLKFIQQDAEKELDMKVGVENYLFDFLKFIRDKIDEVHAAPGTKKLSMFDLQIAELRKHIDTFNTSIDTKVNEIKELQDKMQMFLDTLDDKLEKRK